MSVFVDRRPREEQLRSPTMMWVDPTIYPEPTKMVTTQNSSQNPKQEVTSRKMTPDIPSPVKVLISYVREIDPNWKPQAPKQQHGEPKAPPAEQKQVGKRPIACFVAIDLNHIGWSDVSDKDQFDKKRAVQIAIGRASKAKPIGEFCEKYMRGSKDTKKGTFTDKDVEYKISAVFKVLRGKDGHKGLPRDDRKLPLGKELIDFYFFAKKYFSKEETEKRAAAKIARDKAKLNPPAAAPVVSAKPPSPAPVAGPAAKPQTPAAAQTQDSAKFKHGGHNSGHQSHNKPQHQAHQNAGKHDKGKR